MRLRDAEDPLVAVEALDASAHIVRLDAGQVRELLVGDVLRMRQYPAMQDPGQYPVLRPAPLRGDVVPQVDGVALQFRGWHPPAARATSAIADLHLQRPRPLSVSVVRLPLDLSAINALPHLLLHHEEGAAEDHCEARQQLVLLLRPKVEGRNLERVAQIGQLLGRDLVLSVRNEGPHEVVDDLLPAGKTILREQVLDRLVFREVDLVLDGRPIHLAVLGERIKVAGACGELCATPVLDERAHVGHLLPELRIVLEPTH